MIFRAVFCGADDFLKRRSAVKKITAGVIAHVDAGKTTLAEALLFETGAIRTKGRVDHGDTLFDNDAIERERGITIYSSGASFVTGNTCVTLLDTPGHVDFSSEAERVFSAVDIAIVVISSSDGVQAHTRTLWSLAKNYHLPVYFFVTKCDRELRGREDILSELSREFGNCVDLRYENGNYANAEKIAECSEKLLDEYIETGTLSKSSIAAAIAARELFPVFFGSGLKGDGVAAFAAALDELTVEPERTESFGAKVFKISRDKGERLTHIKLTGGELHVKDIVKIGDTEEKINQIRFYSGSKFNTADSASAGDVCAVTGLAASYAGQTLGDALPDSGSVLEPVMRYRLVLPQDVAPLTFLPKLKLLEEEDPNLRVEWDGNTSSITVSLMGLVQAQILKRVISERFGTEVSFDSGAVIYKETVASRVEGVGHYEPLRHYAEVHLSIEPAPRGAGIIIGSDCSEDVLEGRWQRLIMTHLYEKKHLGVLTGSELTDVRITLIAGRAHLKHTEGGDFRQATYRAVRQGLMKAKSILLEPFYSYVMEVPTSDIGRAITDIRLMGGNFKTNAENGGMTVLTGSAPVKAMDGYMAVLTSYTGGRGKLSLSPGGYGECAGAEKVIEAFDYDPEGDLANSPDSVFCAHGAGFVVKWNDVENYMHLDRPEDAAGRAKERRRNLSIDEEELEALMLKEFGPIKRPSYSEPRVVEAKAGHRVNGVKTSFLIIDGYNVIFAWDDLRQIAESGDLEGARERLLSIVANYSAFTACRTAVVFDAYRVPGGEGEKYDFHGVSVVFTKENETGDAYIERFVYNVGKNEQVRVVTSDWLIQLTALRSGVLRLSSAEFEREIAATDEKIGELIRAHMDDFGPVKAEKK